MYKAKQILSNITKTSELSRVWWPAQHYMVISEPIKKPKQPSQKTTTTLCSEKNTHSHFLPYLHERCVDLNKNCSEYTYGTVDSDCVEIRYSLRPMTSLW